MIAVCGIITVIAWEIVLILVSEIKYEGEKILFSSTVVFTKYVSCSLRCSIKTDGKWLPISNIVEQQIYAH